MDKRFYLTEDEKRRILGLHQNSIKKNRINEADVKSIQQQILDLGGYVGKKGDDGQLGPDTLNAIYNYLSKMNPIGSKLTTFNPGNVGDGSDETFEPPKDASTATTTPSTATTTPSTATTTPSTPTTTPSTPTTTTDKTLASDPSLQFSNKRDVRQDFRQQQQQNRQQNRQGRRDQRDIKKEMEQNQKIVKQMQAKNYKPEQIKPYLDKIIQLQSELG